MNTKSKRCTCPAPCEKHDGNVDWFVISNEDGIRMLDDADTKELPPYNGVIIEGDVIPTGIDELNADQKCDCHPYTLPSECEKHGHGNCPRFDKRLPIPMGLPDKSLIFSPEEIRQAIPVASRPDNAITLTVKLESKQEIYTRNNDLMCAFNGKYTDENAIITFPRTYHHFKDMLHIGATYDLIVTVDKSRDLPQYILCDVDKCHDSKRLIPIYERDNSKTKSIMRGNEMYIIPHDERVGLFLLPDDAVMTPQRVVVTIDAMAMDWRNHALETLRGKWQTTDREIISDNNRALKQGTTVYDRRVLEHGDVLWFIFNHESLTVCLPREL